MAAKKKAPTKPKPTAVNREHWLELARDALVADFWVANGRTFEAKVRVACGWCSGRAIGECWHAECSADETREIFIDPTQDDPIEVLATLLHELVHAYLPDGVGHKKPFVEVIREFGLEGKATATHATDGSECWIKLSAIAQRLGSYPHAKMAKVKKAKKPTTWVRYQSRTHPKLKIVCNTKTIEEFGVPLDPAGKPFVPCKKEDE